MVALTDRSGADETLDRTDYAAGPYAMLRKLPGVTSKNIHRIIENVTSLAVRIASFPSQQRFSSSLSPQELATLSLQRMQELAGPANGQQLYLFLHNQARRDLPNTA